MIKTQNLTKRFDTLTAVYNLSFEVAEGQIFGFLGPNGAGKTTTIRMLCGLIQPSEGKAWVAGHQVGLDGEKVRQSIGLLTEQPGLYEQLNALDNLYFYSSLYSLSKAEADKRIQEILEWLNLWQRRKEPIATYSKGMKQKLAIGRALLHRPKVVFLDEPTASLDAESAKSVRDAVLALRDTKRTIFLCTHNMEEADRMCDQVGIFKTKLLKLDTPANLRRQFGVGSRQVRISMRPQSPQERAKLVAVAGSLPFVAKAEWLPDNTAMQVSLTKPDEQNPLLIRALVEADAPIQFVEEQTASLEEVYLELVQTETKKQD
jgi:ABC-2 type transport system ATP-binding protein